MANDAVDVALNQSEPTPTNGADPAAPKLKERSMRTNAKKKAAPAAKKTPAKSTARGGAKSAARSAARAVRPGSKLETVVGLLTRKGGCTAKDVLAATGWPTVSLPQQAKAAGLTLRKEKPEDGPTRYFAS